MTGISQHGQSTGSGLNDYDYQDLSVLAKGVSLNQLSTVNKIPIPAEIMEHFQSNFSSLKGMHQC
jgi:nuclear pore complex protein Nup155